MLKRKIILNIGICIVVFMSLITVYFITSDENKIELKSEKELLELKDQKEEYNLNQKYLENTQQIILSSLSDENYRDKSEKLLLKYILSYQGKDKSGKSLKEVLVYSYICHPDSFSTKILEWDQNTIKFEFTDDLIECEYHPYFVFEYNPQKNDLSYIFDPIWGMQINSTITYLNTNS